MYKKRKGFLSALYVHITVICPRCSVSLLFITEFRKIHDTGNSVQTHLYNVNENMKINSVENNRTENQAYIITK